MNELPPQLRTCAHHVAISTKGSVAGDAVGEVGLEHGCHTRVHSLRAPVCTREKQACNCTHSTTYSTTVTQSFKAKESSYGGSVSIIAPALGRGA
jgi:hypothetical protein